MPRLYIYFMINSLEKESPAEFHCTRHGPRHQNPFVFWDVYVLVLYLVSIVDSTKDNDIKDHS